ncbi:MAG: PilZ domain-containing protein [Geobacteraceae bacterium]|nr:PilZ domain-containing protein [Geobacteraceae bacterium]
MIDKRHFHRVKLSSKAILSNDDSFYQGQLENISMTGALVRLEQGTLLSKGSEYGLTITIDGEDAPLRLNIVVVYITHVIAGFKFVSFEADSGLRLAKIIEKFSSEPDVVMAEQEKIRKLFADYLK